MNSQPGVLSQSTRDHRLDLLKGLACILMIFAHSTFDASPLSRVLAGEGNSLIHLLYMLGEAAPILFFAVAGITACMQAKKYPPKPVLISFSLLFLLGFSYNGITERDFYQNPAIEIIQIIEFGAALVYIIEYAWKPPPVAYLMIGIGVFSLKLLIDHEPLLKELFSSPQGLLIPPGKFPIFPWLFPFFMGPFAYKTRNINNLILAGASFGLVVALKVLSFPLQVGNKWDMSLGYFLLSCIMLFSSLYVVRAFEFFKLENGKRWILFLGEFSLLFLFIHKFVIRSLHRLAASPELYSFLSEPVLFWVATAMFTTILMKLLLKVSQIWHIKDYFQNTRSWLILAILVLSVPAIIENSTAIYFLELTLGTMFAVYYRLIGKELKQAGAVEAPKASDLRSWFRG